jgi:hypothetical protein
MVEHELTLHGMHPLASGLVVAWQLHLQIFLCLFGSSEMEVGKGPRWRRDALLQITCAAP